VVLVSEVFAAALIGEKHRDFVGSDAALLQLIDDALGLDLGLDDAND